MSNCGPLGWVTDEAVIATSPGIRRPAEPWPPMPDLALQAWHELAGYAHAPEACLINYYSADARMGLHQDRDETEFDAPVVSLSLGDSCLFRVGGHETQRPYAVIPARLR